MERFPQLDIHHVDAQGNIELVAANVPYRNLQWTRRVSGAGEFAATLNCDVPVEWPGRYLVTLDTHREVGLIEKTSVKDGASGAEPALEGRFAESFYDRFVFGVGGASLSGANWRQAATKALATWHMNDIPQIILSEGTQSATGSSYSIGGAEGDSAMEVLFSATAGNNAYPLITYDRAKNPNKLEACLISGVNRGRSQSLNPWWVFSLQLGTISSVDYLGDYSVACSEVLALAERDSQDNVIQIIRTVSVPGFDASRQWKARAFEDVGGLIGQDVTPNNANVDAAGLLRSYDHMPEIVVDASVAGSGYRDGWDLCDLCDVEVPALNMAANIRVEEVREVWKDSGHTVEATLGTKSISRLERALQGRR